MIFRARCQIFMRSDGSYVDQISFRLLKRKSCTGCKDCGGFQDAMGAVGEDFPIEYDSRKIVDGREYELIFVSYGKDYWSGEEDYHLEFIPYKPREEKDSTNDS